MKPRNGRPMRYTHILKALEEDSLYCSAQIVRFAEKHGLLRTSSTNKKTRRKEKLQIRTALNQLATNHQFPDLGDGLVQVPGHAFIPGWYGWRWQTTMYE